MHINEQVYQLYLWHYLFIYFSLYKCASASPTSFVVSDLFCILVKSFEKQLYYSKPCNLLIFQSILIAHSVLLRHANKLEPLLLFPISFCLSIILGSLLSLLHYFLQYFPYNCCHKYNNRNILSSLYLLCLFIK